MKRPAYPAYKDSGIEWLGEIPEHWSAISVKKCYEIRLGKMLQNNPNSDDDRLVPYLKALHVLWYEVCTSDLPVMWASSFDLRQYEVRDGDLLVCEGGEVGRSAIVFNPPNNCIIQNALHRVRGFNRADVGFLMYTLHAVSNSGWFDVLCNKATIAHFTHEKFSDLRIPKPPIPEQRAIAAFLDRETARIDGLIEKKQRQIELLQEKRAALISHAVTKGLDPNAKMKDSGIEWLGDIPEEWVVMRIKKLGRIRYGLGEPPNYVDNGLPFIRATDINRGKIDLDKVKKVEPEDIPWSRKPILNIDEILVVRSGAYTGDSAIVTESIAGCVAGYDMVLTIENGLAEFFAWVLLSKYMLYGQIYLERMRAAQPHLNAEELGSFIVLTPPISEQHSIVAFLNQETVRIDGLINKVGESMTLLREYRTALISAAVTGKIDVRGEDKLTPSRKVAKENT